MYIISVIIFTENKSESLPQEQLSTVNYHKFFCICKSCMPGHTSSPPRKQLKVKLLEFHQNHYQNSESPINILAFHHLMLLSVDSPCLPLKMKFSEAHQRHLVVLDIRANHLWVWRRLNEAEE